MRAAIGISNRTFLPHLVARRQTMAGSTVAPSFRLVKEVAPVSASAAAASGVGVCVLGFGLGAAMNYFGSEQPSRFQIRAVGNESKPSDFIKTKSSVQDEETLEKKLKLPTRRSTIHFKNDAGERTMAVSKYEII